jgi:hypothetical protein
MNYNRKILAATVLSVMFIFAMPALTPRANAAAAPCAAPTPASKCSILLLAPGGVLNANATVAPSFIVSFLVENFTLVQPGTINDVNTTTTGPSPTAHNEGHIHVFVDGVYVTIWTTNNGIPLTLSEGTHTVSLHLVNDFHQEFSPPMTASTTLTIKNPAADTLQNSASGAQTAATSAGTAANSASSTASDAKNAALTAQNYGLGALIVSVITLLLVAYVAFRKPKSPA